MNEYRFYRNADPVVAACRADLAAFYRDIRSRNAPLARVLWRAMTKAHKDLSAEFWSSDWVNTKGGLAEILE